MNYITTLMQDQNPLMLIVEIIVLIAAVNWTWNEAKTFIANSGIKFTWFEQNKEDHADIEEFKEKFDKLSERVNLLESKNKSNNNYNMETTKTIIDVSTALDELRKENVSLKEGIRQLTSDRSNQRIRYYYSIGYIPDEEFDEFCDFIEYAVNTLHCNHGLDRKYKSCKSDLPVLSVEKAVDFKINEEKKEK